MKISIIVPAFNEEKLIARSLERINAARAAFAERGWESELIVCDNNSGDGTAELARSAGARVVFEPVNQIGRARNRGAAVAGGDWLVFIDADSYPSVALFRELAERLALGSFMGGGCLVRMEERLHWFWRFWIGVWNQLSRWNRWAAGSFLVCEAEAFRALGGFDVKLYVSEEVDFSIRLKRLARRRGKKVFILRRQRLATSARKLRLYSRRELMRTVVHSVLHPIRFTRDREACRMWYDGRR